MGRGHKSAPLGPQLSVTQPDYIGGLILKYVLFGAIILILLLGGCGNGEGEKKAIMQNPDNKVKTIIIVSTKGCVSTPPTKILIEETAREIGVKIDLKSIVISTQEEAIKYKFHGSPTILINGLDLDPGMRDNTAYGFT